MFDNGERLDNREKQVRASGLILVVDDNSILREALVAVLENAGHKAIGASDGKAALGFAREHPVALLVTDLIMPGQEGIETIQQFVKEFPLIPIIAISGNPDYLSSAKALGAAVALVKPIGHAKLLQVVRNLLD
jgi:CheY-like chemotaxis protein